MEVRSARPPANRAVAALQSASGPAASTSPLLSTPHTQRVAAPVVRYKSFDALCQARQLPDENAELRAELLRKLPQATAHESATGDQEEARDKMTGLFSALEPATAAGGGSEGCRALRESLLHTTSVEAVVVVPAIAPPAVVATEEAQRTLGTFFVARGVEVRRLVLRRADEATAQAHQRETATSPSPVLQPLRLPAPWALQLVAHMPYLTELDLRHVQWGESKSSQVLPFFFSDLYIANVGTLHTLKVDAALLQYWTPGWWRRHVNLRAITVGSRYSFAQTSATPPPSAASLPPSLLELPSDFYALMREEGRHWQLELWCPLRPSSLQQLFAPAAGVSFVGVEELLVNVRHNERVCEGADHGASSGGGGAGGGAAEGSAGGAAAGDAPADAKTHPKGRKAQAVADVPEAVVVYPRLHTVTVADVSERPEVAAEVYQTMVSLAPELRRFNVCDTVLIGAPVVEGGKGERAKRAGGAGKNVN